MLVHERDGNVCHSSCAPAPLDGIGADITLILLWMAGYDVHPRISSSERGRILILRVSWPGQDRKRGHGGTVLNSCVTTRFRIMSPKIQGQIFAFRISLSSAHFAVTLIVE